MYVSHTIAAGEIETVRSGTLASLNIRILRGPAACPLQWTWDLIENNAVIELWQGFDEIGSRLQWP